jgi:hypothetical protein
VAKQPGSILEARLQLSVPFESLPPFVAIQLEKAAASESLTDAGLQLYLSALNSLVSEPPSYGEMELRSLLRKDLSTLADRLGIVVSAKQALEEIRTQITTRAAASELNAHVRNRFLCEKLEQNIQVLITQSHLMPGSLVFAKLKKHGLKPVLITSPTVWHEPSVQVAYKGLLIEKGLDYASFLTSDIQKVACPADLSVPKLLPAPLREGMAEMCSTASLRQRP